MGIRVEVKQKKTENIAALSMGDTFGTIKGRELYLICCEAEEDGDEILTVVNLSTGRTESIKDFGAILPINLVLTEE